MFKFVFPFMMLGFTARTAFSEDVVVRAQIDGRSRLVLTPTRIYWHHLEYGRPGCCGDPSPKTTIGNIQWLPKWPTTGNSGIRSSGLAVATTFVGKQVSLTLQQARGSVYILQQPSTENGREMVIEFTTIKVVRHGIKSQSQVYLSNCFPTSRLGYPPLS